MVLVIMAAGMGSRYGGLKQIDPVGPSGEFILDYSVFDAIRAGFDKVVFVIKEENLELFRETVGKRLEKHVKVEYAFQRIEDVPSFVQIPAERTKPWGTAHATYCSREYVDEGFAVINSDDFYGKDAFVQLAKFLREREEERKAGASDIKYAMVGYILSNTLTENGHVSRGVCTINGKGQLSDIVERTRIMRRDGQTAFYEEASGWTPLDENSIVSMNCWAFTPEFFGMIGKEMTQFFSDSRNDLMKGEFYLPFVVEHAMKDGECTVDVLKTTAKWHGITYREDRDAFVEAIGRLIAAGEYPESLWG